MAPYRAVIFDLWGTLVDDLVYPEANRCLFRQKTDEVADLLGLGHDEFAEAWAEGTGDRLVGAFSSTEGALSHLCKELGVAPGMGCIHSAAAALYAYTREALSPRPGTVETLFDLKHSGLKVGLITNCGEETARLWDSTPFAPLMDTAVLSFNVGIAKPDPRIYELATRRLSVRAEQCLFVGDGSGGELTGASEAGMTAALIRAPYDRADGARESWMGETISDVRDVLGLPN